MTASKALQIRLTATLTPILMGVLVTMFSVSSAVAQPADWACGALRSFGQFGPFDYRTVRGQPLYLVESTHFLPEIEALIRGHTTTTPGPDLDYTLRAFPNHHRALIAMTALGEKEQTPKPRGSRYSIECWFERAVLFQPDDTTVRMLYATYLYKNNRQSEAVAQLAYATSAAKENGFTQYNIGMVYFDMKLYEQALASAHRALELGFEREELRDRLKSVGQWKEPSPAPVPAN